MPGRYTGPLGKAFSGDRDAAMSMQSRARVLVQSIFDTLRAKPLNGKGLLSRSWQMADGSVVHAYVNTLGVWPIVRTWIESPVGIGPPQQKTLIPYWWESGLLYWNPLANFYPLRVNLGDELKKLPYPKDEYHDDYLESHYWLDTRPDIQYPDYINDFYVDRNFWPSMWSGLARLAMQGMYAIKRSPFEVFGTSINFATQGIWRLAYGSYIQVTIDAAGVVATKLSLPADDAMPGIVEARRSLSALYRNEHTSEYEKNVREAEVLAHVIRVGDPVQLAPPEQIAPILAEGFAVAYGWKFCRNKLEASIVTFREECVPEFAEITCIGQFITNLFTIKAVLGEDDQGQPTITDLGIERPYGPIRSRPRTGITSFYRPAYGRLWNYQGIVPGWGGNPFPACCYPVVGDTVSPYYCFYDVADNLQVVWYIQHQWRSENYDTRPSSYQCGTGVFERSGSYCPGGWGEVQGGFYCGAEPPDIQDFIDVSGERFDETYTVETTRGGDIVLTVMATASEAPFYAANGIDCGGAGVAVYYMENNVWNGGPITGVTMTAKTGTQREDLTIRVKTGSHRLWSCVIAAHDAEAVYILSTEKQQAEGKTLQATFDGSVNGSGTPLFGGEIKFEFLSNDGGGGTMYITQYTRVMDPGVNSYTGWFGAIANMVRREDLVEVSPPQVTVTPAEYRLHTPHGKIQLSEGSYWPTLFPESVLEGLFTEGQPVKAAFSYSGDGMYYDGEGAERIKGGYALNPGIASFFIGGA